MVCPVPADARCRDIKPSRVCHTQGLSFQAHHGPGRVMTDVAAPLHTALHLAAEKPKLEHPSSPLALIIFFGILAAGVLFVAYSLYDDVASAGEKTTTYLPYLLLFVALMIALGFEFVNGFHDTANAVAT